MAKKVKKAVRKTNGNGNGLGIPQVAKAFGVGPLTIKHWRQGKVASVTKMPCRLTKVGKKGHRVSFDRGVVKSWAKKNELACRL